MSQPSYDRRTASRIPSDSKGQIQLLEQIRDMVEKPSWLILQMLHPPSTPEPDIEHRLREAVEGLRGVIRDLEIARHLLGGSSRPRK